MEAHRGRGRARGPRRHGDEIDIAVEAVRPTRSRPARSRTGPGVRGPAAAAATDFAGPPARRAQWSARRPACPAPPRALPAGAALRRRRPVDVTFLGPAGAPGRPPGTASTGRSCAGWAPAQLATTLAGGGSRRPRRHGRGPHRLARRGLTTAPSNPHASRPLPGFPPGPGCATMTAAARGRRADAAECARPQGAARELGGRRCPRMPAAGTPMSDGGADMTAIAPQPIVSRPSPADVARKGSRLSNLLRTTDHKTIGLMYLTTSFIVLHRRRPDGDADARPSWPGRGCSSCRRSSTTSCSRCTAR